MRAQQILDKSADLVRVIKLETVLNFVVDLVFEDFVCKRQLIPSTAGKSHIAGKLMTLFPDHKAYIEPFAGGAAVFFRKEKLSFEVLNDTHPGVVASYKFVQSITQEKISRLKKLNWVATREHRKKLQNSNPTAPLLIFHKIAMLRFSGFNRSETSGGMPREKEGQELKIIDRLVGIKDRLRNTKIFCGDYRKILAKYDGVEGAFFFLDPPYPNAFVSDIGVKDFDHPAFWSHVYDLKSKFLVTYDRPDPKRKLNVAKIKHQASSQVGGKDYTTYVLTNYDIQTKSVFKPKVQQEEHLVVPKNVTKNVEELYFDKRVDVNTGV